MVVSGHQIGFQSQEQEVDEINLLFEGSIPSWLSGSLVRTGPSKFNVGAESFRHWFDGLAMLHKFVVNNQELNYSCKLLHSNAYLKALEKDRISSREFGTNPQWSFFDRLLSIFFTEFTDNANVNVGRISDHIVAMTETVPPVEFNRTTLATIGKFKYADKLSGQVTTAHPHFDHSRKTLFNVMTHMSAVSNYIIYCIDDGLIEKKPLSRIPVKEPGYIHSFGMSRRYLILVEFPFVVNPLELIFSGKPYVENYHWRPKQGTRFLIIDKHDGQVVSTFETEPCFAFHHVNAFEVGDDLLIDMLVYPDASIVQSLYLDNLRAENSRISAAQLRRYRIGMKTKTLNSEPLTDYTMELPRINYIAAAGNQYRYCYGVGIKQDARFLNQLVKTDLSDGSCILWHEEQCYPGEPVFVARPGAIVEDDGVLFSIVLDAKHQRSYLLLLDASSMQEMARAVLPHLVPFGFHGQFTKE